MLTNTPDEKEVPQLVKDYMEQGGKQMKPVPFMIKVKAFHFGKVEVGQELTIEDKRCKVSKITSVRVISGELIEVIGMCKEMYVVD